VRNLRARLGLLGLTDGEGFDPFERCAKNGAHSCPGAMKKSHSRQKEDCTATPPLCAGNRCRRNCCGRRREVDRFRPGDRVACEGWYGGSAERMTAKAARTSRLPDNVDFSVGSTVLHIYLTAYYALVDRARVEAGETVLVTGASGSTALNVLTSALLTSVVIELHRLVDERLRHEIADQ